MAKPELPRGYLGPQPKFSEFRLMAVSHRNPEVELNTNEVKIDFQMDTPVKVTGNLIQTATGKDLSELIFTQIKGNVVSFIIKMPETGYYKLQVYALPTSDGSQSLPGVYNYLLHCNNVNTTCKPFPKQYAQWKNGCCLFEPFHIDDCDGTVEFKVYIPDAKKTAAVVNDEWTHLNDAKNGMWFATVKVCKGAKVTLNANFGGEEETKYSTLLEYKL